MYLDKTDHDEQILGSRISRTDIFRKSLVAGEYEQEYSCSFTSVPSTGPQRELASYQECKTIPTRGRGE